MFADTGSELNQWVSMWRSPIIEPLDSSTISLNMQQEFGFCSAMSPTNGLRIMSSLLPLYI